MVPLWTNGQHCSKTWKNSWQCRVFWSIPASLQLVSPRGVFLVCLLGDAQDPHLNRAVRITCTIYTCNHRSPVTRPLIFLVCAGNFSTSWDSNVIRKYITHVPDPNPLYMWHLLAVCPSQGDRSLICGFPTGFFFIPNGVLFF